MRKITFLFFAILIVSLIFGCRPEELDPDNSTLVITGRVIDAESNTGLANAKVRIKTGKGFKEATTKSDDENTDYINEAGYFEVTGVAAEADDLLMIVTASEDSETVYTTYIDEINTYTNPTDEFTFNQMDVGELGLVKPTGTVSGTVFGINGAIEGVTVVLSNDYRTSSPAAGDYYETAITNENGQYEFTNVPKTSGYTLRNLPFDVNSDDELDYGSTTTTISLTYLDEAAEMSSNLVLPTFTSFFGVDYTNIRAYNDGTKILASTTAAVWYFNKKVVDDTTLEVTCTNDTTGQTILGTTTVDSTYMVVTFTPTNNWTVGHTYSCIITAETVVKESITEGGDTFLVLDDTTPAQIADLTFDLSGSSTATGCTAAPASFEALVEDDGTGACVKSINDGTDPLNAAFYFTVPTGADFAAVYVRNSDVDDTTAGDWYQVGANVLDTITITAPTTVTADASGAIYFNTGNTTDVEAATDKVYFNFELNGSSAGKTNFVPATNSYTIYVMVAACNTEFDGYNGNTPATLNAAAISDGCVLSNVVSLTASR